MKTVRSTTSEQRCWQLVAAGLLAAVGLVIFFMPSLQRLTILAFPAR